MSTIDEEILSKVVSESLEASVARQLGGEAGQHLVHLFHTIRSVYRVIAPETYQGRIQIGLLLDEELFVPHVVPRRLTLLQTEIAGLRGEDFVLQYLSTGEYALWVDENVTRASVVGRDVLLYEYHAASRQEEVVVRAEVKSLPNPYRGPGSPLAPQTFNELREALVHYGSELAKFSTCKILSEIWEDREERLYLRSEYPETHMRRSLEQHLRSSLRDAEVRPEQNMDESKPVDLKISWASTRRHAVIEIKWLGKSVDKQGKVTVEYTDSRARDGARQLADYLDSDQSFSPTFVRRGYLVVYDARRGRLARKGKPRGPTASSQSATGEYRNREIEFKPRFEDSRTDFDPPIRFFLEPKN